MKSFKFLSKASALQAPRFSKANLAVFVLIFACIGGYVLLQSHAAGTTANLWVDTNGGSCTRQSTPGAYNDAQACGSLAAAYNAATGGDTVMVKTGTYGQQGSIGGSKTPVVTFKGEDVVSVNCGSTQNYSCFELGSNVVVDNIDVSGAHGPLVGVYNNTTSSTYQNSKITPTAVGDCGDKSPLLIDGDTDGQTITGITFKNVTITSYRANRAGQGSCTSDAYHAEMVRIDHDVNGVTFNGMHFGDCSPDGTHDGCNTAVIEITVPNPTLAKPRNIVVENSLFTSGQTYFINMDSAFGSPCTGFVFAYNTFLSGQEFINTNASAGVCSSGDLLVVGNLGFRPQTCVAHYTYVKNVWQADGGTPCGSDTLVVGPNYSTSLLKINSDGTLQADSPAIDSGETPGSSDYCTGALGSIDINGTTRPQGTACDAGAEEYATAGGASANLWVDTNGGTCARSGAPSAYNDSAACGSIQAAVAACQPGDSIIMKAGTYGSQSVSASLTSPGCTVYGEAGTTISGLNTSGSNYTIQDITVDSGSTHDAGWGNSASNITLKNVNLHGLYVRADFRGNGSNVTWDGGELGQQGSAGKRSCNTADVEPVVVTNTSHITLNKITFWPADFDSTPCSGSSNGFHLEMARIDSGSSFITIKNSTFPSGQRNNSNTIFLTDASNSGDPNNLTFFNNFFGTDQNPVFGVSSQTVQQCSAWMFAYNTMLDTPGDVTDPSSGGGCSSFTNVVYVGNLGPRPSYYTCNGTFTKNVWQMSVDNHCGTDKAVIGTQFATDQLGLTGDGFHISSTSKAIAAGETSLCASVLGGADHDGDSRPQPDGTNCDAGADEYTTGGSGGIPGDLNSDGHVNITDLSTLLSHYGQSVGSSLGDINTDGTCNITDLSILLSHYGI